MNNMTKILLTLCIALAFSGCLDDANSQTDDSVLAGSGPEPSNSGVSDSSIDKEKLKAEIKQELKEELASELSSKIPDEIQLAISDTEQDIKNSLKTDITQWVEDNTKTITITDSIDHIPNLNITHRESIDNSGVGGVTCGVDEAIVGGGCYCDGSALEAESGVLFQCLPAGNGYVGGCYNTRLLRLDLDFVDTPVKVKVLCAKSQAGVASNTFNSKVKLFRKGRYEEELEKARNLLENMVDSKGQN